jgi:hypothetical protein
MLSAANAESIQNAHYQLRTAVDHLEAIMSAAGVEPLEWSPAGTYVVVGSDSDSDWADTVVGP